MALARYLTATLLASLAASEPPERIEDVAASDHSFSPAAITVPEDGAPVSFSGAGSHGAIASRFELPCTLAVEDGPVPGFRAVESDDALLGTVNSTRPVALDSSQCPERPRCTAGAVTGEAGASCWDGSAGAGGSGDVESTPSSSSDEEGEGAAGGALRGSLGGLAAVAGVMIFAL